MSEQKKFKDSEGHTIYLKTEAQGIKAECPFCGKTVEFWETPVSQ